MSALGGGAKCARCEKTVYDAESEKAAGLKWHKTCFKCKQCNKGLTHPTCTPQGNEIYCKQCHLQSFGPSGYRGGGGPTLKNPIFERQNVSCCGQDVTGKKFCPECGNKVVIPEIVVEDAGAAAPTPLKYCTGCGAVVPSGSKFCAECGKASI